MEWTRFIALVHWKKIVNRCQIRLNCVDIVNVFAYNIVKMVKRSLRLLCLAAAQNRKLCDNDRVGVIY